MAPYRIDAKALLVLRIGRGEKRPHDVVAMQINKRGRKFGIIQDSGSNTRTFLVLIGLCPTPRAIAPAEMEQDLLQFVRFRIACIKGLSKQFYDHCLTYARIIHLKRRRKWEQADNGNRSEQNGDDCLYAFTTRAHKHSIAGCPALHEVGRPGRGKFRLSHVVTADKT